MRHIFLYVFAYYLTSYHKKAINELLRARLGKYHLAYDNNLAMHSELGSKT